jgi:hypothetical protein
MSTRDNVLAVVDGIQEGKILETFDKYYADGVIMSENGADLRVGKTVNRTYEKAFVDNVEFHGARVGQVIVENHMAAVEWEFDITPKGGERMVQKQVSLQTWEGDQIVREVFYHA